VVISFIYRILGADVEGLKFEPFVWEVSDELRTLRQKGSESGSRSCLGVFSVSND